MHQRWLVIGALLAGCGSHGDTWDNPVKELEGFKDKTCACKDKACANRVKRDLEDWQRTLMDSLQNEKKPPMEVMEKVDRIEREMRDCRYRITDKPDEKPVDEKAADKPAAGP